MVEYSDVFDEVDEFQKKAKVTIDHSAAKDRTLLQPRCCLCETCYSGKVVSNVVFIVRRRNSKNVYERRHDRIAARLPPPEKGLGITKALSTYL
jgi:hypothetical protein